MQDSQPAEGKMHLAIFMDARAVASDATLLYNARDLVETLRLLNRLET